jgi:hypothetical protein
MLQQRRRGDIDGNDNEAIARTTYELYCEAEVGGMTLPEVPGAAASASSKASPRPTRPASTKAAPP